MAGLPKNFDAISNVLPTYDFIDIIAGTGYVNFYAGSTVDLKLLSNFEFYSDTVSTAHAVGNTIYQKELDIDFDVVLNRPLDIRGLGIVSIPIAKSLPSKQSIYAIAILKHYDGSTETVLVTNTSTEYGANTGTYYILAVDLNIALKHFKIGETLRLTIEVYAKSNDAGDLGTIYLGHDPKNRSTGWDTTGAVPSQLIFQCPVRLNL